jgi:hypothetical protein
VFICVHSWPDDFDLALKSQIANHKSQILPSCLSVLSGLSPSSIWLFAFGFIKPKVFLRVSVVDFRFSVV